jgi:hypothetical protein
VAAPPRTQDRVGFVPKWFLLQASKGVTRAYWYNWASYRPLWSRQGGLNTAGISYVQVYRWLVGAEISSPCSQDLTSTWTCGLVRPGGYEGQVVWNTFGTTAYVPPSQYTRYRDLAGNSSNFSGQHPQHRHYTHSVRNHYALVCRPVGFEKNG